jgi:two-component system nitrogen regulation sensor histidine kinase GlnL
MTALDFEHIWATLPFPAFVLDQNNLLIHANSAAEQMVKISAKQLQERKVGAVFGENSVITDTVAQARAKAGSLMQYNVELSLSEVAPTSCNVHVGPISGQRDMLLLIIQPTGVAQKMSRSLTHMAAARSVVALSAMLAHELRNPLAGISGAAQLLAMNASDEDRELTELIEHETRRIGKLIDKVEHFGDDRPLRRAPVNIHDVLDRAVRAAKAGFANHIAFSVEYDPSLPDAAGDADQLLQVFQNLIKNAAEAVEGDHGRIKLRTSYHSGVKFSLGGRGTENVPLQIEVTDNGRGIPDTLIREIFDPFVTSKSNGSGLGLPLVSKIISGHGGLIECDSAQGRTTFTIRLPVWQHNMGLH